VFDLEWNWDIFLLIEVVINVLTLLFLVQTMCKRVVEQQEGKGVPKEKWSYYVKPSAVIVSFAFGICVVSTLVFSELDGTSFSILHPVLMAGIFLFWKMDFYASVVNRVVHEEDDL